MTRPLSIVDAFTDRPFAGNPAAVVIVDRDDQPDESWMQQVAAEMNLSETAFVQPRAAGGFALRWFTPAAEVELCGHATLASAHVLFTTGRAPTDQPIAFHTRYRGELVCQRNAAGWIEMDFPADPAAPADPPSELAALVGPPIVAAGRSRYDWLIELPDPDAVRTFQIDFPALAAIDMRGLIVTAQDDSPGEFDFLSRFFAPRYRINEDPVTGSAHCVLGPWWADRLARDRLLAHQASPRGGTLQLHVRDPRITLAGQAATITEGTLLA